MARIARVVAVGAPHPITQPGNNRQNVILGDDERRYYLSVPRDRSRQAGLRLLGYCLMTNHIHLVAVPVQTHTLAQALGRTHSVYTQRSNRHYHRSGHLWQNCFYSCPLGASHLYQALAYVDLNPVRAGMSAQAGEYAWSSAWAHLGDTKADEWIDGEAWHQLGLAGDWAEILRREVAADELARRPTPGCRMASRISSSVWNSRLSRRFVEERPDPSPKPERKALEQTELRICSRSSRSSPIFRNERSTERGGSADTVASQPCIGYANPCQGGQERNPGFGWSYVPVQAIRKRLPSERMNSAEAVDVRTEHRHGRLP